MKQSPDQITAILEEYVSANIESIERFFYAANRTMQSAMMRHRGKDGFLENIQADMDAFYKTTASSTMKASQCPTQP
jgi:hypothetical protein